MEQEPALAVLSLSFFPLFIRAHTDIAVAFSLCRGEMRALGGNDWKCASADLLFAFCTSTPAPSEMIGFAYRIGRAKIFFQ